MKRTNFPTRKAKRRVEATARQEIRNKRTAAEQLAILDTLPGESKKERARLKKA